MDKLSKLMALKKSERQMSPVEKKAKMDVLGKLSDEMGSMMGDKLKGLKKVTVASDSPVGLEEGLDKAKELLAAKKGDPDMHEEHEVQDGDGPDLESMAEEMHEELRPGEHADEDDSHDESEADSQGEEDQADMSDDDLDGQIRKLMMMKEMRNRKVNI